MDRPLGSVQRRHNRYTRPATVTESEISGGVVSELALANIRSFQRSATAENTRRGYETHWRAFVSWCGRHDFSPLPAAPLTVAAYLSQAANLVDEAGEHYYSPGTISRWLTSINRAHSLAGFVKPGSSADVELAIAGIRRARARPIAKKAPLLLPDLRLTLNAIDLQSWPSGVIGHRDWAILLLGFAGAYRRSELASLTIGDVRRHTEDGLHVTLRRSKTDQEATGSVKGLPFGSSPLTCAPCAYARWLRVLRAAGSSRADLMRVLRAARADIHICREPQLVGQQWESTQPLFRPVMKNGSIASRHISGDVVNVVVRRRVAAAGIDPEPFGAHSLRAGFVTQAFRAGATHHEIMRQTGHKDVTTLEGYSRENDPLAHNAVARLGL